MASKKVPKTLPVAKDPDPRRAYAVHSIFYTLQGEGVNSGQPFVFVRFSGCNVWSGREKDRERDSKKGVCARWCDTVFAGVDRANGGGTFTLDELVVSISTMCQVSGTPRVLFTGGEPLLQLDEPLLRQLETRSAFCAVETNGSLPIPHGLHWVTLSPKPPMPVHPSITQVDELKLVYPDVNPSDYANIETNHRWVTPRSMERETMVQAVAFCKANPEYRLNIQDHKVLNIP